MSGIHVSASAIRNLFTVITLITLAAPSAAFSHNGDSPIALPHDLSTTERVVMGEASSKCFTAYVWAKGVLMLEVSAPNSRSIEPIILFFGKSEPGSEGQRSSFRDLDSWATSLLVEIEEPGDHLFCIGAQNPEHALGEVKLSSAFGRSPVATKGGDPDEDEEEPDTQTQPSVPAAGGGPIGYLASDLCGPVTVDDHSDVFRCASPILTGKKVDAEIANARGDDEDVFFFVVDEIVTLRIEGAGDVATSIRLYDRVGQQLRIETEESPAGSFFFETLSPGTYFLRVSARYGEEGRYRLSANVAGR